MPSSSCTTTPARPSSASLSRASQATHSGSSKAWDEGSRASSSTRTQKETRAPARKNTLSTVPENMAVAIRSPTVESRRYEESNQRTVKAPSRQNSSSKQTVTRREDSRYESRGGDSRAMTRYESHHGGESHTRGGDSRALTRHDSHRDDRTKTVTRGDHHTQRSHTVTRAESTKTTSDKELELRLKKLEDDKARQLERQVDKLENKVEILQAQANQKKTTTTAYYVYDPYPNYHQGYMDGACRR